MSEPNPFDSALLMQSLCNFPAGTAVSTTLIAARTGLTNEEATANLEALNERGHLSRRQDGTYCLKERGKKAG